MCLGGITARRDGDPMEHGLLQSCLRVMHVLWIAAMVVLDGLAGLAGAVIPERWLLRYRTPLLGFAAGALLASGLGEVLPEAVTRGGASVLWWGAGAFGVLAAIERVSGRDRPVSPIVLMTSDGLHNIGDGMAIAASFLVSVHLGIVTSLAVIVHEVPEEIADYTLLRASHATKKRSLLALMAVQLTAALGAAGTLFASSVIAHSAGAILSIAGGTFAFIAIVDLIPRLLRERSIAAFVAIAAGAITVLVVP